MSTTVVNRRVESFDVYIGRPSKWGNRWTHLDVNSTAALEHVATRDEAIERYRVWLKERIASGDLDIEELRGKRLGCWCKQSGKNIPCHGDVIVEILEGIP